jgi:hypothetical protein
LVINVHASRYQLNRLPIFPTTSDGRLSPDVYTWLSLGSKDMYDLCCKASFLSPLILAAQLSGFHDTVMCWVTAVRALFCGSGCCVSLQPMCRRSRRLCVRTSSFVETRSKWGRSATAELPYRLRHRLDYLDESQFYPNRFVSIMRQIFVLD